MLSTFDTLRLRQNWHHFTNAFSWMKMYEFHLRFHWSLFLRFKLTIFQHCFRWWLGASQATSHYLNQWWFDYWCRYVWLGFNELTIQGPDYSRQSRSIAWLFMPWGCVSPWVILPKEQQNITKHKVCLYFLGCNVGQTSMGGLKWITINHLRKN